MKAPIELKTKRLILRQPLMSDAGEIFERYASVAEVTKHLVWPRHRCVQDTEGFLRFSAQEWERWPAGPYLILLRAGGQVLGSTGFGFQTTEEAITGYVLARDAWGKGFATEALKAMVELSSQLGLRRLSAACHPENGPSIRVLEKCGFVRENVPDPMVEFANLSAGVRQEAFHYVLTRPARRLSGDF
jgi:ribosomal-protein-alanine N-acetyltransferase